MSLRSTTGVVLLLTLLVLVAAPAWSATWYIKSDGTGDAPTIQAGITASTNGDTVLVAAGTYTGVGNLDIDFLGKAVVLISESGPDFTTIDCQMSGRGVLFQNGEGPGSVLSGFTIANALATGTGGAIFCDTASPEITNNILVNNDAGTGAGIFLKQSAANVHHNTLDGNTSGMYIQQNAPTVHHNIIVFSTSGSGVTCIGGTSAVLSNNNIFGNIGGDALCGVDGGGNMSLDPQFCGIPGSGNYYLQSDSPCAPGQIGALPVLCSTTPTHQKSWGAIKALYR